MPHKIGIVSKNISFYKRLDALRRSDSNFEMELIKSMPSLTQIEDFGKIISSFIFDSSLSSTEILSIGQYIHK